MMANENVAGDMSPVENTIKKDVLVTQVKGKVKWFNVELGYGFINRDDTNEDVFVHHTAIAKYNTRHQLSSLADGELVEFDVVQGKKGQEAANVTGPNGEQVKGSRFASNLYAGRFRFRRGTQYGGGGGGGGAGGGGGGGRRFFSRKVYRDRSAKESISEETKQAVNEKSDKIDPEVTKDTIRSKKYSKNRKSTAEVGQTGGGYGRLKRSSSLPSDLGRYASGNGQRRRRRGPRADGRPFFRTTFSGMKRRGPRVSEKEYSADKAQGKKIDDVDPRQDSSKSEKEGRGEGELKGSVKGDKTAGRRVMSEGKSEKSGEHTSNEKSDKSQQSRGRKRSEREQRANKNSEVAGEKIDNSQSAPEDDQQKGKDDSGDANKGPRQGGRWRRNRRRGGRGGVGGGRSSSTEMSTQTPSTREADDSKSEKEKRGHGGNGDGAKTEPGATDGNVIQGAGVKEPVSGQA